MGTQQMKKIITILVLSMIPYLGSAKPMPSGYEWGNGGFFVACSEASSLGAGVFSVDRIEGMYLHNFKTSTVVQNMDNEEVIIQEVLQRLKVANPVRAMKYQKWYAEIKESREWADGYSFMLLPDSSSTVVPQGCEPKQAAIFVTSPNSEKVRFIFDKSLWDRASALDRAYLIFHELIYREATLPENEHQNSIASRYFNGWIFSRLEALDQVDILSLLKGLHFKNSEYNGISIVLSGRMDPRVPLLKEAPIDFYPNSKNVKRAALGAEFSVVVGNEVFNRVCNDPIFDTEFRSYVEFYPSGKVKSMHFDDKDGWVPVALTPRYQETNCSFHGKNYFEFDERGNAIKIEFRQL